MKMTNQSEAFAELWDLAEPCKLPHSRLFRLEPIGIGTPYVECLTSYLTRLAVAHHVSVHELIANEIAPQTDGVNLFIVNHYGSKVIDFRTLGTRLNGLNRSATHLVRILETLTSWENLHLLTMLPWSSVLPTNRLMKRHKAWCAACFEEWRCADAEIYEPLLWMVDAVRVCTKHLVRLSTSCPHSDCGRFLPLLSRRTLPGYCTYCGRWLGVAATSRRFLDIHRFSRRGRPNAHPTFSRQADFQIHSMYGHHIHLESAARKEAMWIAEVVGTMLSIAPYITEKVEREVVSTAVSSYIENILGGNMCAFARQIGSSRTSVSDVKTGRQLPTLITLLHICSAMGTTPTALFTGIAPIEPVVSMRSRSMPSRKPRRNVDTTALGNALEGILASQDEPFPPMREVAQNLGFDPSYLYKKHPQLCRAISERHSRYWAEQRSQRAQKIRDDVRQRMIELHEKGIYPSNDVLSKIYGVKMRLYLYSKVRRDTLEELGYTHKNREDDTL